MPLNVETSSCCFLLTPPVTESKGHCGFQDTWSFIIAGKSEDTLETHWFSNEAEVNHEMRKRCMLTKDGTSPFHYFDGSTMKEYFYPKKTSEAVFCRRDPMPESCQSRHGTDVERPQTQQKKKGSPTYDPANARKELYYTSTLVDRDSATGLSLLENQFGIARTTSEAWNQRRQFLTRNARSANQQSNQQ